MIPGFRPTIATSLRGMLPMFRPRRDAPPPEGGSTRGDESRRNSHKSPIASSPAFISSLFTYWSLTRQSRARRLDDSFRPIGDHFPYILSRSRHKSQEGQLAQEKRPTLRESSARLLPSHASDRIA